MHRQLVNNTYVSWKALAQRQDSNHITQKAIDYFSSREKCIASKHQIMNLKNYTTEVPASRSIDAIEKLLVNFGARNIMKEYGPTSNVVAIAFILEMDGMKLPFRLPANVKNVYTWLKKHRPKAADKLLLVQAERVCWKQQHEWVHLQLSLIEIEQAEILELFFPRLYDVQKGVTYYEQLKQGKFKALLSN